LKADYHVNFIDFQDELLMTSEERVFKLCEQLKKMNVHWWCSGRLNYAKPALLKDMKDAGCVFINYGIESMDDSILKRMNKHMNTKQIVAGVEATQKAGIGTGLNMMWGNIGDNLESLNKSLDFLLKYQDAGDLRTIRPVTPYPGCDLYKHAIAEGMLTGPEDFYEKHVNSDLLAVNFTDISDDDFHGYLGAANSRIIVQYYDRQKLDTLEQAYQLYHKNDTSFRGFRKI